MKSYFFNALATTDLEHYPSGWDREYDADDHAAFFAPFFSEAGVMAGKNADACKVQVQSGTTLAVSAGVVYIRGRMVEFDGTETITVDKDCKIVVRLDKSMAVRDFQLLAVTTLTRTDDVYDMELAGVHLEAVSGGHQVVITDTRTYLSYMGQPPYYPPSADDLPYILWLYTMGYPMTAEQRAAVEGNPSLMAIYNSSIVAHLLTDYLPLTGGKMTGALELEGNPTKPLHALPLSAALSDGTKSLLGLPAEAMPDDALIALLLTAKQGSIVKVSVTAGGAPAKAGIVVTGLEAVSGGKCYTDASGLAVGFTAATTTTISISEYVDIPLVSKTIATPVQSIIETSIDFKPAVGEKMVTTTSVFKFSPYIEDIDICCVGGGGGANYSLSALTGGAGAGGGYVKNALSVIPLPNTEYTALVGAGGKCARGSGASDGGQSSFINVIALGGKASTYDDNNGGSNRYSYGGDGNGSGGIGARQQKNTSNYYPGTAGNPGTVRAYGDLNGTLYGGGGGGSGVGSGVLVATKGGAPFGGDGGEWGNYIAQGNPGKGYGGGAGGGGEYSSSNGIPDVNIGSGYQGLVRFRWRVAA